MIQYKLQQLEKWWGEKIQLIKLYFRKKESPFVCRMGDIYFAKLGVNIGAEIDKSRPVLVFQGNDRFLHNSDLIFIFPITSNIDRKKYTVLFTESHIHGNLKSGAILVSQGRTISKVRLGKYYGKLNDEKLITVGRVFQKFLYKKIPSHIVRGSTDSYQ